MKTNDLRDLSLHELEQRALDAADELFNMKIRHSLNQLDNPLLLRKARRDLARIKTLVAERRHQDGEA
ncbi:MAG: 50S ribosomal protein L29 [Candidatus Krumholzibacteriota bacterium]|nr:50S ribosomal protein L29 [Candidatus Krumholzibacteriota bacterium]